MREEMTFGRAVYNWTELMELIPDLKRFHNQLVSNKTTEQVLKVVDNWAPKHLRLDFIMPSPFNNDVKTFVFTRLTPYDVNMVCITNQPE